MPLISWNDRLSVGVAAIDQEHQQLVSLLNRFYDSTRTGQDQECVRGILDALIDYTRFHFANEEKLLTETRYPDFAAHKKLHEDLTRQVLEEQRKYKISGGSEALSLEIINFLKTWLLNHIQGTDKKYGPYVNSKGVR